MLFAFTGQLLNLEDRKVDKSDPFDRPGKSKEKISTIALTKI